MLQPTYAKMRNPTRRPTDIPNVNPTNLSILSPTRDLNIPPRPTSSLMSTMMAKNCVVVTHVPSQLEEGNESSSSDLEEKECLDLRLALVRWLCWRVRR